MEMARVGISERPKAVRRAELRSNPFNTEVEEEEEEVEEEGKEVAITDANGRSMAIGMSADVWESCEAIAAGGCRTVSLVMTDEEGASTGGGATSATGTGSLGLFGFGICETVVKLARGSSELGTE